VLAHHHHQQQQVVVAGVAARSLVLMTGPPSCRPRPRPLQQQQQQQEVVAGTAMTRAGEHVGQHCWAMVSGGQGGDGVRGRRG
jgi:hypothetical protein